MSNDESILSNASVFGTSGGNQTQIIKVLASVVETQKNIASQFSTLFDRIEEARNESRRNVTALTEEIKKLEQRSSSVFEKVMSQLITQNEALGISHANERAQWREQNENTIAMHASERAQWIIQNENMLSLIRTTLGNVPRPAIALSQPMQAYNQAMTANAMFGGVSNEEQPLINQFHQLTPNQVGALQLQMHQAAPAAVSFSTPRQVPARAAVPPVAPKMEVKQEAKPEVKPVVPTPAPTVAAAAKPKVEEPKKTAPVAPAAKPKAEEPKKNAPVAPAAKPKAEEPKKTAPVAPAAASAAWGDKFKMTAGEWECVGCYVRNPADSAECSCCGTANPNCEKKESDKPANPFGKNVPIFNPADASSSSGPKFSFGLGGGSAAAPAAAAAAPVQATEPVQAPKTLDAPKTETATGMKTVTPAFSFSSATTVPTAAPATPKFSFMQAAAAATKEEEKPKSLFGSSAAPSTSSNAFGAGVIPAATTPSTFSFKSATTPGTTASPVPAFSFKTVDSSKPASIFGGSQKTLFGTSSPSTPVDGKKAEVEKKDTPSSVFGSSFMGDGQTPSAFSALSGKPSIFDQQDKVAEGQKNFASLAKSKPFGQSATAAANEEDGEEGEQPEEYEPDVEFAPVIPLPDLVEVKTGEEDEKVLFTARSKIFRYVRETKEYKERGVGELKLLHNETTNKYRVLMRRDQVHKLCANFSVLKSSNLMEKQGQSNVRSIVVTDFAENEAGDMESFCIKFKNGEVAKDFENAFHDAQANLQ